MEEQILNWIKQATKSMEEKSLTKWESKANHKTLIFKKGRKYFKLLVADYYTKEARSVYCFIDLNGNIYKAASYNSPAKGIRGNIVTKEPKTIDQSGSWLYK